MDPITLGLIFGAFALLGGSVRTSTPPTPEHVKEIEDEVILRLRDASRITVPPELYWSNVETPEGKFLVSPYYIAPVGIGEAQRVAKSLGYELPTVALVNAIWNQADLKLDPLPRGPLSKPPSDYGKSMNSIPTHINQLALIQAQIQAANPNFKLLAGTHKDVVYDTKIVDGKPTKMLGIYGWHKLNGKIIQDFQTKHQHGNTAESDWKDYSQGLRLVKRLA